jgi:hypothetical protein
LWGPYGGGKGARRGRNVLQDGDEWLRRAHEDCMQRVRESRTDDPTFLYRLSTTQKSVQPLSSFQQYTHHIWTFHTVTPHRSLLRLTLLDNTTKRFLTD